MIVILMAISIVANVSPNAKGIFYPPNIGFWITIFLNFLLGLFNSFQQNSCIAIASILGGEAIGSFWIGTGFSGTIICIFRMICLATMPNNNALGCLLYFQTKAPSFTFL
jgi:hypothetical protein